MPPTSACAASSRLFGFGATAHGRRHGVVGGGQQRAEVATPQLDGRRVELAHQHVGSHGLGRGRSGGREVPAGRPEAVELLGQGWVLDGKAEAVSLAGSLRGIGNGVGAGERTQGAQPGEEVVAGAAPPGEDEERVGVERLGEQVEGRGDVLARYRPVRAGAGHGEVPGALREEGEAAAREHLLDLTGHLPGEELRAVHSARGEGGFHPGPVRLGEAGKPDADAVRPCPRCLHAGAGGARCDPEVEDLAGACVGAATPEARAHAERLEDGDEPSRPPALADLAAAAARFDAALDPPRPRRRPVPVVPVAITSHSPSYSETASGASAISSRSRLVDSSVSQLSPPPTISSASAFFSSISASIRSSSVPTQTSLRTCTSLRWPMRKARSVAWSSTAGFHQRSKWKTWLALVRLRPTPPARSERMNTDGSVSGSWNSAIIRSRLAALVPPCR